MLEIARHGPSFEAEGHIDLAMKALNANVFDVTLEELYKAEQLDSTLAELWIAYLVVRARVRFWKKTASQQEQALVRLQHTLETEFDRAISFLDADQARDPSRKLLLNYCLLGAAVRFQYQQPFDHVRINIAHLLASTNTIDLNNAAEYLAPLMTTNRDRDEGLLAPALREVRRYFHIDVLEVCDSWMYCFKRLAVFNEHFIQRPEYVRISSAVYSNVPGIDRQAFNVLSDLKTRYESFSEQLRTRSEIGQKFPIPGEEDYHGVDQYGAETDYSELPQMITKVSHGDFLWISSIVIVPWLVVPFAPWSWYYSLTGTSILLLIFWQLHRLLYRAELRKFERRELPILRSRLKDLDQELTPPIDQICQDLSALCEKVVAESGLAVPYAFWDAPFWRAP